MNYTYLEGTMINIFRPKSPHPTIIKNQKERSIGLSLNRIRICEKLMIRPNSSPDRKDLSEKRPKFQAFLHNQEHVTSNGLSS